MALTFHDFTIRRHLVTGPDDHDIAGRQFLNGNFDLLPSPLDTSRLSTQSKQLADSF